jgi:glyoxylase-like metal-dependent hydrolase (beta-lactamase superfamily II)
VSSTYTYLLGCEETGQAVLIDPVLPAWERDLGELRRLGLKLVYTIDTHIHADHITGARKLREEAGSRIAHPAADGLACVDLPLMEDQPLEVGSLRIEPLHTPGHTDHHFAYLSATAHSPATPRDRRLRTHGFGGDPRRPCLGHGQAVQFGRRNPGLPAHE